MPFPSFAPRPSALRLPAALLCAVLPLAAWITVSAETAHRGRLDALAAEVGDAATQAATAQAEAFALAGRLMQAIAAAPPQGPAEAVCASLRARLSATPAASLMVHGGDARAVCAAEGSAAHVPGALAARGGITLTPDPALGLVLARTLPNPEGANPVGETRVLALAIDPARLAPVPLPLRRHGAVRLLVDPDDGAILAAQPDHGARAGEAAGMPRLVAAMRAGPGGVEIARDGAGNLRIVGHAPLPLAETGLRFAGRAAFVVDLPYDALLAEAGSQRRAHWLAALALAAAGLVLAWLVAGKGRADRAPAPRRAPASPRPEGAWLRRQEELAAVAEAADEMFLRLDAALRVTYASPATERLLGVAPGAMMDTALSDAPGWAPCLALIGALRAGDMAARPARIAVGRRDGATMELEVRARRLGDGGFLLASRDIRTEVALRRELDAARESLAALGRTDGPTGLANRRRFDETLARELARARRSQEPLSLVLLRLDGWEACAAQAGPMATQEALRQVGRLLGGTLRRPGDLAGRLDEALFGVLLPTTDRIGAQRVAERVRAAVADAWRHLEAAPPTVRIGAGSVLPLSAGETPATLLELAGEALEAAHADGTVAVLTQRPVPAMALEGPMVGAS